MTEPHRFELHAGHRLEAAWWGPPPDAAPTLVLLHEGLGSVSQWKDFPAHLQRRSGLGVLAYSRWGYGRSEPVVPPRPLRYMHDEGEVTLPAVLAEAGVRDAILVGHSDGGSIALIHAGATAGAPRVRALALLAPHVFCEDVSVASIAQAREAYLHGDLRRRLARHHDDVDGAFWGWNRAWLDPGFRAWNLEEYLPRITIPTLVVQGVDDPYGTLAQVDTIARAVRGPLTTRVLPACGHSPWRDRPDETTAAILALATSLTRSPPA